MKTHFYTILLIAAPTLALTQTQELGQTQDEYLYSVPTMNKLHHIVDSLNLRFRTCEVTDIYRSIPQACGKYVELVGDSAEAAADLLRRQPALSDFQSAFPSASVTQDMLVYKQWNHYEKNPMIAYKVLPVGDQNGSSINLDDDHPVDKPWEQRRWIWRLYEADGWSKTVLRAFYMESEMKSQTLPLEYARLVQYVDCMVDTTETKLLREAEYGYYESHDPAELQAMPMNEKIALLKELRSTEVIGGCSMDQSPRYHARDIAILAAETHNWGIFLRAHLDIMNDRFERVSDGSYAWPHRKTYLRELEALDFNTTDLILGISLRFDNPHPNHYYGSIGRLGRAIAEAEDATELEASILRMIQDPALDDFNRVVMHNLYLSYIYQDQDPARQKESKSKFLEACKSLPPYIAKAVKAEP